MRMWQTPSLARKLKFLQKHTKTVAVAPTMLSAEGIQVQLESFCDFECALRTADLVELAAHPGEIAVQGNTLSYRFSPAQQAGLTVHREVEIVEPPPAMPSATPLLSIRVPTLPVLTQDDIELNYADGVLVMTSSGRVRTRAVAMVERLSGIEAPACRVRSSSLRLLNDLEGEHIISFCGDFLIGYGIEPTDTTAILIRVVEE